jgi:hypothetical protein
MCIVTALRDSFVRIFKVHGPKFVEFQDTVEQGVFDKILQQYKDANRYIYL